MTGEIATTVSTLYALRAGLSAVAIEYEGFHRDCATAYNNLSGARDRAVALEKQYQTEQQTIQEVQTRIGKIQKGLKKKRSLAVTLLSFFFAFVLGVAFLLLCVYCILGICAHEGALSDWRSDELLLSMYDWWTDKDWIGPVAIIVAIVGLLLGGGGVLCSFFILSNSFRRSKNYKIQSQNLATAQAELSARMEQLTRTKAALDAALQKRGIVDYEAFRRNIAKKGNVHLIAGNVLYRELKKQFAAILDERDWGNLDYIIYAIETGRAESLKEALQMCDRELQTERLEKSIQSAARQISRTIEYGLRDLQDQMDSCFRSLSQDIHESKGEIITAVSNSVSGVNARLSQIASASALNSALLAKANENSAEIAKNVSRLRDYADFRFRREA